MLQLFTEIGYAEDCEKNDSGIFKQKGIPFIASNL